MARHSYRDAVTNVLLAQGFVTRTQAGEIGQVEADTFSLEPGLWQWNGSAWVAFVPTPVPDERGFEAALHTIFAGADQATLNALATTQPLFMWSMDRENWPAVEQILKAALAATTITAPQYAAIKAAAAANHIPVSL
jgi:hypothetical protein